MKLKPCPFCGSTDIRIDGDDDSPTGEVLACRCAKCWALGPPSDEFPPDNDYGEAIAHKTAARRWNRRKEAKT